MSIRQTIIILACFLIIQPFLGFTSDTDTVLNVVVGLLIVILSYKLFPVDNYDMQSRSLGENLDKVKNQKNDLPFVEHRGSDNNSAS